VKRIAVAVPVALAAGLLLPAAAGAHAFLVRSDPAAGADVARVPRAVRLFFDEGVRPAPGIEVVRNGGGSVLAGRPLVPAGKPTEIDLPLRSHLQRGDYTVRWREIDVDDGHLIEGVFPFKIGTGGPPPTATLTAGSNDPPFRALASRWLLLVGLLLAAGTSIFALLVWRPALRAPEAETLGPTLHKAHSLLLAGALALVALGALLSVVLEPGTSSTTFGHRMEIGAAVAACAALVSLASLRRRALLTVAGLAAVVLLGLPTVTGHALQHGVVQGVSVPADLVHLAAAGFWIGGSFELALVAPFILRTSHLDARRAGVALVVRYSPLAVLAAALLGISGVLRAFGELSSVEQLWTTGYGQTLLVKSGLLGGLVALGWLNRYRLTPMLVGSAGEAKTERAVPARLRRSIGIELVLLAVALGAVAVLTNLRPGRDYVAPGAAAATTAPQPVVLAGEAGDLAVGVGITPRGDAGVGLRATVLGPNGPASGLGLRFIVSGAGAGQFAAASPCGPGCYRATAPSGGRLGTILLRIERPGGGTPTTLAFKPPARLPAPGAAAIVHRATAKINQLRTLVIHSRLASDADHEVTTTYDEVAPNRLAYRNSDGSASVIIGSRRWDRSSARGHWRESPQQPIREPVPFWPAHVTDAHVLRIVRVHGDPVWVVSFLDPVTPAWFTIWVDRRSYQTLRLQMIATAHFMHNRNGSFDAPIAVERP